MATLGPMRDAPVTIEQIPADGDEAIACVAAYYRELDERFDGGFDPVPAAMRRPTRRRERSSSSCG